MYVRRYPLCAGRPGESEFAGRADQSQDDVTLEVAAGQRGQGEEVADRVDWHDVAKLVQRGCPAALAVTIIE
jgi:hypothetical protein